AATGTESATTLTVDETAPTAPSAVNIVSDNAVTTLAKSGDTVTITATVDAGTTVTGTIGGQATTTNSVTDTTATLTRVLDGTETEGALDFTLVSTDAAGNDAGTVTTADTGSVTTDFTAPKLLSANGTNSGIADLFNAAGDRLDLVFTETIKAVPTEADSETNFILIGIDGDNFPTKVGSAIIALTKKTLTNDTIVYTFNAGDTANANLIDPGVTDIDVNVGNVVANSIEDLAGNDLLDTDDGGVVSISETANSPNAPTLVSPTSASYTNDTTPTVTWNIPIDPNGDDLHFIVYFDTVDTFDSQDDLKIFDSAISSAGFSGTPPYTEGVGTANYTVQAGYALSQTTWYWRVVAKDHPDNFISAPSSTWSMVIDTTAP
ncbi:MAG: hypothetical protein KAR32_12615, partial [Candidatus Omnitrophica bacterium]|nr:hypothetical protein [Candidatus Omnitrophota bacterium]